MPDSCPRCGRESGPYRVLNGWRPCLCGGHRTRECVAERGGCGHVLYVPALVPGRCQPPRQGFTAPRAGG